MTIKCSRCGNEDQNRFSYGTIRLPQWTLSEIRLPPTNYATGPGLFRPRFLANDSMVRMCDSFSRPIKNILYPDRSIPGENPGESRDELLLLVNARWENDEWEDELEDRRAMNRRHLAARMGTTKPPEAATFGGCGG
jgi:hypothetical protein